jgi:uncharacterized membrane protein YbhN (UPF0104 family)
MGWAAKAARIGRGFAALAALALAVWLIRRELATLEWSAVPGAIVSIRPLKLAALGVCMIGSYGCLALIEPYAFRYAGHPLPFRRAALTSLTANALANGLGFGMLTGVASRLRLYRHAGVPGGTLTEAVALLSASTFLSGVVALGLGLALSALTSGQGVRWAALLLLTPALGWFLAGRGRGRAEPAGLTAADRWAALAAALGDWIFSALGLFALSTRPLAEFPGFLASFQAASLAASIVGVPGALGLLEAATLHSLSSPGRLHEGAAALIVYRLLFFLVPLALASAGLAAAMLVRLATRGAARARR